MVACIRADGVMFLLLSLTFVRGIFITKMFIYQEIYIDVCVMSYYTVLQNHKNGHRGIKSMSKLLTSIVCAFGIAVECQSETPVDAVQETAPKTITLETIVIASKDQ